MGLRSFKGKKSQAETSKRKQFWAKNVAKSFVSFAPRAFVAEMPEIGENLVGLRKEMLEGGNVNTTLRGIRDTMRFIKRKAVDEAVKVGLKNTMEDIRSGNLYNKKRADKVYGELAGIGDDDFSDAGDFGGYAEGDDDFGAPDGGGDNFDEPDGSSGDADETAMDADESENKRFLAEQKTDAYTKMLSLQNTLKGMDAIQKTTAALVQFHQEQTTSFYNASLEYYDSSNKALSMIGEGIDKLNEHMETQLDYSGAKAFMEKKKKANASQENKSIAEKFQDWAENTFGDESNMDTFGMFKSWMANPVGAMMEFGEIGKIILPKEFRKSLNILDSTVSGFRKRLIAKSRSLQGAGGLKDLLFQLILGDDAPKTNKFKMSDDDLKITDEATQFDKASRHSIVEIIPELLSRILNVNENIYEVIPGDKGGTTIPGRFDSKGKLYVDSRKAKNIKTDNILRVNNRTGSLQGTKSLLKEYVNETKGLGKYVIANTSFGLILRNSLVNAYGKTPEEAEGVLQKLGFTLGMSGQMIDQSDFKFFLRASGGESLDQDIQDAIISALFSLGRGEVDELNEAIYSGNQSLQSEIDTVNKLHSNMSRLSTNSSNKHKKSLTESVKNADNAFTQEARKMAKNTSDTTIDSDDKVSKAYASWFKANKKDLNLGQKSDARSYEAFRNSSGGLPAHFISEADKHKNLKSLKENQKTEGEKLDAFERWSSANPTASEDEFKTFLKRINFTPSPSVLKSIFSSKGSVYKRRAEMAEQDHVEGDGNLAKAFNKASDFFGDTGSKVDDSLKTILLKKESEGKFKIDQVIKLLDFLGKHESLIKGESEEKYSELKDSLEDLQGTRTFKKFGILKHQRRLGRWDYDPNYTDYERIMTEFLDFSKGIAKDKAKDKAGEYKEKLEEFITKHVPTFEGFARGGVVEGDASDDGSSNATSEVDGKDGLISMLKKLTPANAKDKMQKVGTSLKSKFKEKMDSDIFTLKSGEAVLSVAGAKVLGKRTIDFINKSPEKAKQIFTGVKTTFSNISAQMNDGTLTKNVKEKLNPYAKRAAKVIQDTKGEMADFIKNNEQIQYGKGLFDEALKEIYNQGNVVKEKLFTEIQRLTGIDMRDYSLSEIINGSAIYLQSGVSVLGKSPNISDTVKTLLVSDKVSAFLTKIRGTKLGKLVIAAAKIDRNKIKRGLIKAKDKLVEHATAIKDKFTKGFKSSWQKAMQARDSKAIKGARSKFDKDLDALKKKHGEGTPAYEEAKGDLERKHDANLNKIREEEAEKSEKQSNTFMKAYKKAGGKWFGENDDPNGPGMASRMGRFGAKMADKAGSLAAKGAGFLGKTAGKLGGGIKNLAKGGGLVGGAINKFTKPGQMMMGGIAGLGKKALVGGTAGKLGGLAGLAKGGAGMLGKGAMAMATNPIGLAVLGLAATGFAAYKIMKHMNQVDEFAAIYWRQKQGDTTTGDVMSKWEPKKQAAYQKFLKKQAPDILNVVSKGDKVNITWKKGSTSGVKGTLLQIARFTPIGAVIGVAMDAKDFKNLYKKYLKQGRTFNSDDMNQINSWGTAKQKRFQAYVKNGGESKFTKNVKSIAKWALRISTLGLSVIGEKIYAKIFDESDFRKASEFFVNGKGEKAMEIVNGFKADKLERFKTYYANYLKTPPEERDQGVLKNTAKKLIEMKDKITSKVKEKWSNIKGTVGKWFGSSASYKGQHDSELQAALAGKGAGTGEFAKGAGTGEFAPADSTAVKTMAGGGWAGRFGKVKDKAAGYLDKLPRILNPKEFVLRGAATAKLIGKHGKGFLDKLNTSGSITSSMGESSANKIFMEILNVLKTIEHNTMMSTEHLAVVSSGISSLSSSGSGGRSEERRPIARKNKPSFNEIPSYTSEGLMQRSRSRINDIVRKN